MNLKANERALSSYSRRLEEALEALKVAELQKVEAARLSTLGQLLQAWLMSFVIHSM